MNQTQNVTKLRETLHSHVAEGALYQKLDSEMLECFACGHRCKIRTGREGICKVRYNKDNRLLVPWGYVSGIQVDPIEKKPFFHVFPGTDALSFGMLGCDLHCSYCQNWITSQSLRDDSAVSGITRTSPSDLVSLAKSQGASILTSTYNEPLITAEWAVEIFKHANDHGFPCSFVSNGNATPEVLEYIRPFVQFYKIDLKSFNDKSYRKLGTKLDTVLDSIRMTYEMGFWIEIVTLVVPGLNDSEDELGEIAEFIAEISPAIPWHVTAFHPDYKMTDRDRTTVTTLVNACELGKKAGLQFVYAGNLPGETADWENTYCPSCNNLLVERTGFQIHRILIEHGQCPKCQTAIPGHWDRKQSLEIIKLH